LSFEVCVSKIGNEGEREIRMEKWAETDLREAFEVCEETRSFGFLWSDGKVKSGKFV
jgi:hypothetical protein